MIAGLEQFVSGFRTNLPDVTWIFKRNFYSLEDSKKHALKRFKTLNFCLVWTPTVRRIEKTVQGQ